MWETTRAYRGFTAGVVGMSQKALADEQAAAPTFLLSVRF
jgi:hypothetical protein